MTRPTSEPPALWDMNIDVDANNPRHVTVVEAPDISRIALLAIDGVPFVRVDEHGINIADQVWYTPLDVDPATLTLICRKTRDLRPLVAQAKERRTRVPA